MPAVIPIVAAVAGGVIASSGAKKAANTQAAAADRAAEGDRYAADLQMQQYQQGRADQAPWREAGAASLNQLTGGLQAGGEFNRAFTMADYQQDPGYQFRLQQGQNAIQSGSVANGSRYSGATLKALTRFNSDQASQEYGAAYGRYNNDVSTRFNRLASVAGVGQTATNQTTALGASAASNAGAAINRQGQSLQDAATARASGYVGAGNAINGTLGQLANNYALSSMAGPQAGAQYGSATDLFSGKFLNF